VDPAWCHAELAYLTWAVESPAESEEHWTLATELGFDPKACAHGQRIAAWESELLSLRTGKVSSGRPTTHPDSNGEWVFPVGRIEVHTGIGPALPGEVEETLLDLQKEFASFLGIKGPWTETVRLHLHRTIEEHEKARLRQFPEGYRGKGFLVQEPQRRGRPGRFGPRDGDRKGDAETLWRLDMHVAFSEPDLERSLSHELAHAMLHVRTPRAMNTAVWFDEGLATYLELSPDEQGHLASETLRADLLEAARAAQREKTLLPWREMLRAQRPTFAGSMAYTRYAQAWAMIFFLVHETSSGRVRLRKYIGGLESEGRDWIGGFSTVWDPDLEAIDRRFRRWLETAGSK
jgi:hypothetical protein